MHRFYKILIPLAALMLLTACGDSLSEAEPASSLTLITSSEVGEWTPDADSDAEAADWDDSTTISEGDSEFSYEVSLDSYEGFGYHEINGNEPYFTESQYTTEYTLELSELDDLGRCGTAFMVAGKETMPTGERSSISHIHPSGWTKGADADDWNRSHLLMYALSGLSDEPRNLITGTREFNAGDEGMLYFEEQVTAYIRSTGNHVLYRVTPFFEGDNLIADGVLMEASSVEDHGDGLSFCVFVYNVQDGLEIDYATGNYWYSESSGEEHDYVLNVNSMTFHDPSCSGVSTMNPRNRKDYHGTRASLAREGYNPCGYCDPQ